MAKAQLPTIENGVLPTVFVRPEQAGRLTQMLEISLEQTTQVAGGATVSATTSAATLTKVRLCRIIACRVMCRVLCQISCMVVTPQTKTLG